jgi:hypothetical protein
LYGGKDVFFRVGSRGDNLSVAEAIEGWEEEELREC